MKKIFTTAHTESAKEEKDSAETKGTLRFAENSVGRDSVEASWKVRHR